MLVLVLVLLFLIVASVLVLMPAIPSWAIYDRYRGIRAVICPETHRQVAVRINAFHAAATGVSHIKPELRMADCTRWPERAHCGQECLDDAIRAEPYRQGEVSSQGKKIYHLPVLLAAAVAWVIGAVWHSQFVFRGRWGEALGLSTSEAHQMAKSWGPHLLSVGVVLLFAYGVALLLGLSGRHGIAWGIAKSVALWIVLAAFGMQTGIWFGIPVDVLRIELGYTFLASVVIGAIIGGLNGRMLESRFEEKISQSASMLGRK